MTNKGKVLAAVVAVAVVLAVGAGLYLKGGDLMGKLRLSGNLKPTTSVTLPAYNVGSSCPAHQDLYGNMPITDGVYQDFDSFYNSIWVTKNANDNKLDCPYAFHFSQNDGSDVEISCDIDEVFLYDKEGTKSIRCSKNTDFFQITAVISRSPYDVFAYVRYQYLAEKGSVVQILRQPYYRVVKNASINVNMDF